MSSLTPCNYCTLKAMERRAKKRGVEVIMGREEGWITARYSDQEKPAVHFMALSDHCVC